METDNTKKFTELFSGFEDFNEEDQKQKIIEINRVINEMNKEEFKSVFTVEMFNKMNKMIEEKKLTINKAFLLLKYIASRKALKMFWNGDFSYSGLSKNFEKLIIEEDMKKEGKNEKLFIDLCECYLSLSCFFPTELLHICVFSLLKVALKKEETEEAQKEVEMALLTLSDVSEYCEMTKDKYLNETKEIILYHQERHNLTRLAYQCTWMFMIRRIFLDRSLEEVVVNELHFSREARRELEELSKCIDWKREKEEEEGEREVKEEIVLLRWLQSLETFFESFEVWNDEFVELIRCVTQIFQSAKDNYREISGQCTHLLNKVVDNGSVNIYGLLKGKTIEIFLEEIQLQTLNDKMSNECFAYFLAISLRLKGKEYDKMKEAKRKITKRKVFEKIEEEGYEDCIISFCEAIPFFSSKYYYELSKNISDYFVNV